MTHCQLICNQSPSLLISEKSAMVRRAIDDLRTVAFEVVKTLGYLRWQCTIHADLKPENILLSMKGRHQIWNDWPSWICDVIL